MLQKDFRQIVPAAQFTTAATFSSTYSYRLPRVQRHLERIRLYVSLTVATNTTGTDNWLLNLVKQVRVNISDPSDRTIVRASGVALMAKQLLDGIPIEYNLGLNAAKANEGTGAKVFVLDIPIRPYSVNEPVGNHFSLPLWALAADPIIEVDIGAATDAASTFTLTGNISLALQPIYREPVSGADGKIIRYIPSELIETTFSWPGTGDQVFDKLPEGGFLLSLLQLNKNGAAFADLMTAGYNWQLRYAQNVRREESVWSSHADNYAQSALWDVRGLTGTDIFDVAGQAIYWDFLTDQPLADAFSPGSVYNLNLSNTTGNKVDIRATNLGTAGTSVFLAHRIRSADPRDIDAITGA